MADKTDLDSPRRHPQISRDLQVSDSSIPLSPQWLLQKPGENKTGTVTGDINTSPFSTFLNRSDTMKSPRNGDQVHDTQKKKEVFRPSMLDSRERWRDEERETNSFVRKDRRREGDKELGDSRKVDWWADNSSGRHSGEARRAPSERWGDSGNKDANHDPRRESKWNTRWGPDDKETGGMHDKWAESGKDHDIPLDKGLSHTVPYGKDEQEGDHHRPWRSSSALNRGRGDSPNHQSPASSRQTPMFVHGRGRGENQNLNSTFSLGRGRGALGGSPMNNTSSHLQSIGSFSEKGDRRHEEGLAVRYSRTKLLDVYRTTDMKDHGRTLDGVVLVPSLMQEESLEPLALISPTPEELLILKGIDKGDILSSGAPQTTKDGSVGRNLVDVQSRRNKLGSREDLPLGFDNHKDETADSSKTNYSDHSEGMSREKQVHSFETHFKTDIMEDRYAFPNHKSNSEAIEDGASYVRNGAREPRVQVTPAHNGSTWISLSVGENGQSDSLESRASEVVWSQPQRATTNERNNSFSNPSYAKDGLRLQVSEDPVIKRHPSGFMERENEARTLTQPSPEDLVLFYKDPKGAIQGPFTGSDIIGWFEAGYFGIDLQVRLANALHDSPFALLGDVMPHLRAKARPPPGFTAAKQSEINDESSKPSFTNISKLHAGLGENAMMKNDRRFQHGSTTEAENRFIESLMSSNMSGGLLEKFGLSEGMQGPFRNSSSIPAAGTESGDNLYQLAKRIQLERQKSLSNPYSLWSGRDASSIGPKSEILQDPTTPASNILSAVAENLRQQPLPPSAPNPEFMSILQGLSDRPTSAANTAVANWSNFPVQGGLDPLQDKLDMLHGKNFPVQTAFGIQQRLQAQNLSSLTNLHAQGFDNLSSPLTPEKLLASGLPHDPQLLNLLQQQQLSQLKSQAPIPVQQLSILDEYVLLKQQQQKQEQLQQQILRQQLLSQVLAEQHPMQQFAEQSYGQLLTSSLPTANASVDNLGFQPTHEIFQMGSHNQVSKMQDVGIPGVANVPPVVPDSTGSEISIHLPHQIKGSTMDQKGREAASQEQSDHDAHRQESKDKCLPGQISPVSLQTDEDVMVTTSIAASIPVPAGHSEKPSVVPSVGDAEKEVPGPEIVDNLKASPSVDIEVPQVKSKLSNEPYVLKEAKPVETRGAKKAGEKKPKKQKSSKTQSADLAKAVSKTQLQPNQSETEVTKVDDSEFDMHTAQQEMGHGANAEVKESKVSEKQTEVTSIPQDNTQVHTVQRAWKPAPGFKPKSLLEIQQEEQRRALAQAQAESEMTVPDISTSLGSMRISTPWVGVVGNSDHKSVEKNKDWANSEPLVAEGSLNQKSKKSQLHDLFAGENPVKSAASDNVSRPSPLPVVGSNLDSVDDDNFIDAKESKKSRKKSSKGKTAAAKVSVSVGAETPISSGSNEKVKTTRQEKDLLPALPSGPSLGDFVIWKGETATPAPAPAWSTDAGKFAGRTSLRDILKEQEKKVSSSQHQIPVPASQKSVSSQSNRGNGPSWSSSSSPAKAASPVQVLSRGSSQSRNKVDDDLFWGPSDHPQQETKQSDFPQLANQGSWTKNTSGKGVPGGSISRQKPAGGKPSDTSLSSSPAMKGKRGSMTKHSEAMDFRDWCKSECVRLLGTKDTSFLEFCLKQSRSEAEILLKENLGSYDPNHDFIDKFLNYKDFMPSDVLELAFQPHNDQNVPRDANPPNEGGGGKKKGKKGKKVSPDVLGFNVVSNRIMMGEIETIQD